MRGRGICRKCETIRCNERRDAAGVEGMDGEVHERGNEEERVERKRRGRRESLRKISKIECDEKNGRK